MQVLNKAHLIQYSCAFSAGLGAMVIGAWTAWPAIALQQLTIDYNLSTSEKSILVAMKDIGNIISPIPTGYLMDWIGRKNTLLLTAVAYITASACVLSAPNIWFLYTARFLIGLGKGTAFVVTPYYLIEISNTEIRGSLISVFILCLNLGMVYDYSLASFCLYDTINHLNLLIALIFGISFSIAPESPWYYVMKGREEDAIQSLCKLRWCSIDTKESESSIQKEIQEIKQLIKKDLETKSNLTDLVTSVINLRAMYIVQMLAIFQRTSGIGPLLAYSTLIMPDNGINPIFYLISFSTILVVATYLVLLIVDKVKRRTLLIISSISTSAVMGIAAVFYYNYRTFNENENFGWIPVICFLLFGITYSLGIGIIPNTVMVEMFPQDLKRYAGAVTAIVMASTTFILNRIFLEVTESEGAYVMFGIFSIASFLCTVFSIFFVIETKDKTYEEIQNILSFSNTSAACSESGDSYDKSLDRKETVMDNFHLTLINDYNFNKKISYGY